MSLSKTVNEYLYYEFGGDLRHDPGDVADDRPFILEKIDVIASKERQVTIFEFVADEVEYFALAGSILDCFPKARMMAQDIHRQVNGAAWTAQRDPVDLSTSRIGDDLVPPAIERRLHVQQLAATISPSTQVLEALYLRSTGVYLALIEDTTTSQTLVVGTDMEPHGVGFPQASVWRRLAFGVGRMLEEGTLK